jgi:peptidoglycan hydrolase CwlO-like protein
MKNLNKQTDLSQEETKKYEEKIKELSDKINNFTS